VTRTGAKSWPSEGKIKVRSKPAAPRCGLNANVKQHAQEAVMPELHGIRRHADGSIDMDFYRKGAHALRGAQFARMGRGLQGLVRPLLPRLARPVRPDRPQATIVQLAVACAARANRK
jgi:hypothetical protein